MRIRNKTLRFALLGMASLCLSALPALGDIPAASGNLSYPQPGTLNYIEGSANLAGQKLNNHDLRGTEMSAGQVLHTHHGKAEVLLTPGVFLRVDDNSAVKMISPDIANTKVALLKGEIGVEVDQIHTQNDLQIVDNGVTTRLVKDGFYEFVTNRPAVLVFSGEAQVETGNGRYQKVKKHHDMALVSGAEARPHHFNPKNAKDNLYNWSKLRSQYLAEANQRYGREYGWRDAYRGWYWNPWALNWDWAWGDDWGPGWAFGWGPAWGWGPGWGYGYWGDYDAPLYYRHYDFDNHAGMHEHFGDHDGGFRGGGHEGGFHEGGGSHGGGRGH